MTVSDMAKDPLLDQSAATQGAGRSREGKAPNKAVENYYARHPLLEKIPQHIVRQAWFTKAHLLLPPGARIGWMGCEDGAAAYTVAALNPDVHVIGIDSDKKRITKARNSFDLPNLEFQTGDITKDTGFEAGSLDGIVNSFILHDIYSNSRYNDRQVAKTLEYQFTLLKQDGLLYIRDYALQFAGDYVMLEMPDTPGTGKDIHAMSEAELLVWYSENARPREDPGCHGFFLEELPPRFPKTRLFRLSYKWAYEFILRKDKRDTLQAELHKEYAFFTERDFRKTVRLMGGRALYSAPHWDESQINARFEGHFRLLDENGKPMGPPPTSFITVAQKVGERRSLRLQERRPSQKPASRLRLTAMRNEKNGRIVDVATRDMSVAEIIPYRVVGENQLNIFVHESLPRGIVNAVPRNGKDLDGKRWSGHMIEAISVPADVVTGVEKGEQKEAVKFSMNYLGLKPAIAATLETGPGYYPAPDYIDEMVQTRYLRVMEHSGPVDPKTVMDDIQGFTSFGRIREVSAQSILDAIAVGLIPHARLELQILTLFDKLGIEAETWDECPLVLEESEPDTIFNAQNFARLKSDGDNRYKDVRGTVGQLRTVQSIFVDEGWVEGGVSGLASRDMEFVLPEDHTLNRAALLPLTTKAGEIMVGFEVEYLPIPQRHEGNGLIIKAPCINLPRDITNLYQAKKYIADLCKIPPENVWRMGESYFCHSGMTPQRIFPFAIATKGEKMLPTGGLVTYAPLKYIWRMMFRLWDWKHDTEFMSKVVKTYRRMCVGSDQSPDITQSYTKSAPDTAPVIMNVSSVNVPAAESSAAADTGKKLQIK